MFRERDVMDFARAQSLGLDSEQGRDVLEQIARRRRRGITMLEELSLRTQRLLPCMKRLEQISARMLDLQEQILNLRDLKTARSSGVQPSHDRTRRKSMFMVSMSAKKSSRRVESVISVPVDAIFEVGDAPHVYVRSRGQFEARRVELGDSNEVFFVVKAGLEDGERVVVASTSLRERPSEAALGAPLTLGATSRFYRYTSKKFLHLLNEIFLFGS